MYVIGLAGGSGSGKGVVSNVFRDAGYIIYDTDAVYHDMISRRSSCTQALADAFGDDILNEDGSVNRPSLAKIVFAPTPDAEHAREVLNRIAHSHVRHAFEEFIQTNEGIVVLDAPLLFEAGMQDLCNITIAVTAPRALRIARIIARDHINTEDAERRVDSQIADSELVFLCDYQIDNASDVATLTTRVKELIKIINKRIDNHE